jgi:phosphomannomutase
MTLSQLVEEAPKRFQAVRKIPVDPAHKQEIVAQAQALLCQTLGSQVLAENWLDGLRIELAEGWVIVRPSGTENVIRVQADAPTQARADELVAIGAACVEQALKQAREEGGKR